MTPEFFDIKWKGTVSICKKRIALGLTALPQFTKFRVSEALTFLISIFGSQGFRSSDLFTRCQLSIDTHLSNNPRTHMPLL